MTTGQVQHIVVKAMSTSHARKIASALTQTPIEGIGRVDMVKKPRQAKTCQTDDYPTKGTRKWVTEYQVYSYGQRVPIGRNKYDYTHLEFVKGGFTKKGDAVKEAREQAIKQQLPMTVKIVKVLENDTNTVTDLEPKSTYGEYRVAYHV